MWNRRAEEAEEMADVRFRIVDFNEALNAFGGAKHRHQKPSERPLTLIIDLVQHRSLTNVKKRPQVGFSFVGKLTYPFRLDDPDFLESIREYSFNQPCCVAKMILDSVFIVAVCGAQDLAQGNTVQSMSTIES